MFNWFSPNAVKSAKEVLNEVNTLFPTTQWKSEPKFIDNGQEYTLEEFMSHVEEIKKENKELKDILSSIKEDGAYEHNKAVELRQENANLKYRHDELVKEVLSLRPLKDENHILKAKITTLQEFADTKLKVDWKSARIDILERDLQKCAQERDEYKHQLNAANKEIEKLKEDIDEYKEVLNSKKVSYDCLDLVCKCKDHTIKFLNNEIQELKRTEKYYVCNHCGYKVAHDTNYWGGCGFCKDGLMIEKEEQKNPMYPIHWGGYDETVENFKKMNPQGFEDYDPSDFVEPVKDDKTINDRMDKLEKMVEELLLLRVQIMSPEFKVSDPYFDKNYEFFKTHGRWPWQSNDKSKREFDDL